MAELDEENVKVGISESGEENLKEENEKLKKVVSLAQNKIKAQGLKLAEIQKQSELKDKIISTAKEKIKQIQDERDQKAKDLDNLRTCHGRSGIEAYANQIPQRVLERIQVGTIVWCLVQFQEQSRDLYEEEEDGTGGCIWVTQDELVEHVNKIGCTLDLPLFSLSSSQATALRNEMSDFRQKYDSLAEEYKKYRVDVDVMIWNKNTQIESLKSTKDDSSSWNSQDISQVTDEVNSLKLQKQALKEKIAALSKANDSLQLDKEEMKLQLGDSTRRLDILKNECEEWRWKYKEEIKRKRQEVIDTEQSQINNKETISSLKQELEYMKSKNDQLSILLKKVHETEGQVPMSPNMPQSSHFFGQSPISPIVRDGDSPVTSGNGGGSINNMGMDVNTVGQSDMTTKNKYLRSLFYNYLCSRDRNSRIHMQTALMTIFQFTPDEVIEIKKRASSNWW